MKEIKNKTLAEGETTGHAHRIKVAVMEREDGVRIFEGETEVTHEEHKTIKLPNRKWNSDKVLETDHIAKMQRKVID
jgi:hypothetical protein